MSFLHRLRAAIAAFRNPPCESPTYAVIYDIGDPNVEVREEYYGFFGSRDEARKMFDSAFPPDPTPGYSEAHTARLVQIIEEFRPCPV